MNTDRKKCRTLELIGRLYENTSGAGLNHEVIEINKTDLEQLSKYLKTSNTQTLLMAIIFASGYDEKQVNLRTLKSHFGCNPITLLQYNQEFEVLFKKGYIKKQRAFFSDDIVFANDDFIIEDKIAEAIVKGEPIPIRNLGAFKSTIDLLGKIYSLSESRYDRKITTENLFHEMQMIISFNMHDPLIQQIKALQLNKLDTFLLLYVMWKKLANSNTVSLSYILDEIFDEPSKKINCVQEMIHKKNELLSRNLVEIEESSLLNDLEIKLTQESMDILKKTGFEVITRLVDRSNIICHGSIKKIDLFFNEVEQKQLKLFKNILEDDFFSNILKRLEAKNLPKGITCLLSGPPGVGKTAYVKQLARKTGRDILVVDLSQTKSMWFGESEKIVKKIFADYINLKKDSDKTPILLINEADGIFSKRRSINNSIVSNTENTVQNILLEELENFEGIFVATTNMPQNLDNAYNRRFLFKIDIKEPETAIKELIWKAKIPELSSSQSEQLSASFNFSGGEIDNITRKLEIDEIISGQGFDFDTLMAFCNNEKRALGINQTIGFS